MVKKIIKLKKLLLTGFVFTSVFQLQAGDSLEVKNKIVSSTILKKKPLEIQDISEDKEIKEDKPKFQSLRFSGYSRLWGFYRNLKTAYPDAPLEGLNVPVTLTQDDGSNEPLLLVRLEANPSPKTWFQMEYMFDNRFLSTTGWTDANGNSALAYRVFQFQGSTFTSFGTFKLIAGGGVNWYKLSPFTLWNYQYRDDLFERYPWEPEGSNWGRYDAFYSLGDIPRDQRWGNRGTQGFILEGAGLPYGFDFSVLYGKNENSGGFQSFLAQVPQNMLSGRLTKRIAAHKFGFNYFNQFGYNYDPNESGQEGNIKYIGEVTVGDQTYLIDTNRSAQVIATVDGRIKLDGVNIFTEIGMGSYLSSNYFHEDVVTSKASSDKVTHYKKDWDPLAYLEFDFDKSITKIPIKLAMYHIGRNVVNNTSTIFNTTVEEAKQGPSQPQTNNTTFFGGLVNQIGQLPNNRQGVTLRSNNNLGKVKLEFGYETSQELENTWNDENITNGVSARNLVRNSITFHHQANQLARSRFAFFQRLSGPYNRNLNAYRRSFTNLGITDTAVNYKKSFTTLELTTKYKTRLLKKELILSLYTQYSSVQEKLFAPVFDDEAFLRYSYAELMAFYKLHSKVTLVGFASMETAKGNSRTELADADGNLITDAEGIPVYDVDGKPIDQLGYGYGLGVDYDFAKRASIHYRHRFYNHEDGNFTNDKFEGQEATVELKVFF